MARSVYEEIRVNYKSLSGLDILKSYLLFFSKYRNVLVSLCFIPEMYSNVMLESWHATLTHFKIDMEIYKIVTRDMEIS